MLSVAYIGNGKSVNRYHLPFVLKNPNFTVKTIYSRTESFAWERIPGVDYGRLYEGAFESIVNGASKIVQDNETIQQLEVLQTGIRQIPEGNPIR